MSYKTPVGSLDWYGCEECIHANHEEGGCLVLSEKELGDISNFDIEYDDIVCRKWQAKPTNPATGKEA